MCSLIYVSRRKYRTQQSRGSSSAAVLGNSTQFPGAHSRHRQITKFSPGNEAQLDSYPSTVQVDQGVLNDVGKLDRSFWLRMELLRCVREP